MGVLARNGYEFTPNAEEADVLVVNTCSFIAPAQKESIDTILEMAEHKKFGARQETDRGRLPGGALSRPDTRADSRGRRGGGHGGSGRILGGVEGELPSDALKPPGRRAVPVSRL